MDSKCPKCGVGRTSYEICIRYLCGSCESKLRDRFIQSDKCLIAEQAATIKGLEEKLEAVKEWAGMYEESKPGELEILMESGCTLWEFFTEPKGGRE